MKRRYEDIDLRRRLSETLTKHCENLEVREKKSRDALRQWSGTTEKQRNEHGRLIAEGMRRAKEKRQTSQTEQLLREVK
jgi:hypothetical protein